MKLARVIRSLTVSASLVALTAGLTALPAQAKPNHKGKPGYRSGLIKANRHVFNLQRCQDDQLTIKIKIPRSIQSFWNGESDVHLMVTFPADPSSGQADFSSWNLRELLADRLDPETADNKDHPLFRLSCSVLKDLPPGPYQLALVMTIPGGDPENLSDWYQGFQGLVATSRVKISETEDESDRDGDGEVDGDTDHDGMVDENEEASMEDSKSSDEGEDGSDSEADGRVDDNQDSASDESDSADGSEEDGESTMDDDAMTDDSSSENPDRS